MVSQLDSRIEIVTPENIAFEYRLAGPFRRLPAYLIDFALRAGVLYAAGVVLPAGFGLIGAERLGIGMVLVCWFLLSWFYGGFFETYWNGQTPGKRVMKLRVLTADGQPITGLQAVLRNVLRAVDSLPLVPIPGDELFRPVLPLYILGLLAAAMSDRFQRLGDLVCGTIVIVELPQRLHGLAQVTDEGAIELARSLPADISIDRALARALAAYVERRRVFAVSRRSEIARALGEPLCARYSLPPDTSHDLLLMALYYRAFISDRVVREDAASMGIPAPARAAALPGGSSA